MAALGQDGFDANDVEPNAAFDPIPAGNYQCVITESEEKENSKGTGTYVQFTLEVIDGEFKGRKVWERLNLNNPSEEAVKISRAVLSAMCRAAGKMAVRDSTDLHNLPMVVKVGLEKRKDTGELQNRIKGYIQKGQSASSPAAGKGAAPATPPWKRK